MNKKGFTLVELLTTLTIIILLTLIAVPSVSGIMSNIKKSSFENSIYGLIESATVYYNENLKNKEEYTLIEFKKGEQVSNVKLDYKGNLGDLDGKMVITEAGDIALCLGQSDYYVTKGVSDAKVKIKNANGDLVCSLPGPEDDEDINFILNKEDFKSEKCETNPINEKDRYKDSILKGADPELYEGMIPITYEVKDGVTKTIVADVTKKWYSYSGHSWANAVIVNYGNKTVARKYFNDDMTIKAAAIGDEIPESDILQYYVWIPRYRYKLFAVNGELTNPQNIQIIFENKDYQKSFGTETGEWLTHPAFTFEKTELNGIWIGKYETSGEVQKLTIKPNVSSLRNITISAMFQAIKNMENVNSYLYGIRSDEIDTHLIKSIEWGAMAYLSSSKYGRYDYTEEGAELSTTCEKSGGCEVWINCNSSYITGCGCATVSASGGGTCNKWDTDSGRKASTNGNITGIYDTSGGSWEYVMANMVDINSNFNPASSGFTGKLDYKYIDNYIYSDSCTTHFIRSKLGDAVKETQKTDNSATGAWNNDYSYLICTSGYWMVRGGTYSTTTSSGIFAKSYTGGGASTDYGFRNVITAN